MKKRYAAFRFHCFYIVVMIFVANCLHAQDRKQDNPQDGHFTGSLSGGPNYYFNNIVTFGNYVKPVNYCFFGKIMWNSRYLVSLGIETGYNRFYRVDGFEKDAIKATLTAIPLHLVIGMRVKKVFYAHFSFGPSLLLNSAYSTSLENRINNKVLSLADGSVCVGYRKRLTKDFTIGAELKFSFSTKAEDLSLALPIVFSYDF
jgi:hypothetical protein